MRKAGRIASLDGLRRIAALAVMEFHFSNFFLPQARLFEFVPYLNKAYLAVDLFFLLSGFVMAHVYGAALASDWRGNWQKFAIARFARIYPLFAVTTLAMVTIFVLSHIPIWLVSFSGRSLSLQPVLMQQWASGLSWNYPSWSISTEAEAYLFFVFFARLLLKVGCPRVIATCCIFILIAVGASNGGTLNHFTGPLALLRTLSGFSLGVLLYRAHCRDVAFSGKWLLLGTILLILLGSLAHQDSFILGAFVCVIQYCVNDRGVVAKVLNCRPLLAPR